MSSTLPMNLLNTTFVTFIKEVNEKFNELASLKSRCGDHFIAVGLKQVADDDLKVLEKLFSPRSKFGLGKNLTVEEKTVKCLELLFPALKELDWCSQETPAHTPVYFDLPFQNVCGGNSVSFRIRWAPSFWTVLSFSAKWRMKSNDVKIQINLSSIRRQWHQTVCFSDCSIAVFAISRIHSSKTFGTAESGSRKKCCFGQQLWFCNPTCPPRGGNLPTCPPQRGKSTHLSPHGGKSVPPEGEICPPSGGNPLVQSIPISKCPFLTSLPLRLVSGVQNQQGWMDRFNQSLEGVTKQSSKPNIW